MIVCIIQARTGSTRLPGKVLLPILGKPMFAHQIDRVKQSRLIDKIVVATTTKKEDDPLENIARTLNVGCYRGSEKDVLDRFYQAAREAGADIVIRLTGDCPLSDPAVIDETIEYFLKHSAEIDYTSKPTNYPEGLDMEIFSFGALERAWREGVKPSEREHVTPYIYNHPEIFRVRTWQSGQEDFSTMHWSVDTAGDFVFATKVFEELSPSKPLFSKDDVLALLKNDPEVLLLNTGGTGYEGYAKSLKEDEAFQEKEGRYLGMIGFVPEVLVVLSGGTVKETDEKGSVSYRSTNIGEEDTFGILWGEARVIAVAELGTHFPQAAIIATSTRGPGEPSHAKIIRDELSALGTAHSRVILEEISDDTLSQIGESLKIIYEKGWKRIVFVTNEYQIPRAHAMYEHFEKLLPVDTETKKIVESIKRAGARVQFIAAEEILPHRDKKFIELIAQVKRNAAYKKRVENEARGTAMVISGEYGSVQSREEDKLERKSVQ